MLRNRRRNEGAKGDVYPSSVRRKPCRIHEAGNLKSCLMWTSEVEVTSLNAPVGEDNNYSCGREVGTAMCQTYSPTSDLQKFSNRAFLELGTWLPLGAILDSRRKSSAQV